MEPKKLSHKQRHAEWKKQRRKKIRQAAAKARDEAEKLANPEIEEDEALLEVREQLIRQMEERERERLHAEWLAREEVAMEKFRKLKESEETLKETSIQAFGIEKEAKKVEVKSKGQVENNRRSLEEPQSAPTNSAQPFDGPWCNPSAPDNYGTELDKHNCPFFLKVGACRFGDRCSRGHLKPTVSCTLLIPGMFSHFSIDKAWRDEFDSDMNLEYEENECYQHFKEFYEDTLPEFKACGKIVQFKVCCNFELHLRGNVYVQYESEEDAIKAFNMFNGRWYASRQLSCEFSPVTKWKSAICGLYHRNKCPKGRNCNFLHVFKNPNKEFLAADYDVESSEDAEKSWSGRNNCIRSARQSTRRNSSRSPEQSIRRKKFKHKRSRSGSREKSNTRHRTPSESPGRSKRHSSSHKSRPSRKRKGSHSTDETDSDNCKRSSPISNESERHSKRRSSHKKKKRKS
ncbi:U2 small nuclear ribonucleoprotein auxiliary factor 35 kDa subunit- protein 2 [Chamberlinius hualienensis]